MTITSLITLNAALGAAIAYGLHHLLAHGIHSDRRNHPPEVAEVAVREAERIAA